jgi:hypothetical protein
MADEDKREILKKHDNTGCEPFLTLFLVQNKGFKQLAAQLYPFDGVVNTSHAADTGAKPDYRTGFCNRLEP